MADYETGVNVILGGAIGPRIRASLEEYARRKGMPLREYVKTHIGFMAALLALNVAAGMRVYDVVEEEAMDQAAIDDQRRDPSFILDDQTHIFFRSGDYEDASPEGIEFLDSLGGGRKSIVPGAQGIIDMTKDTWVHEVFFLSDTYATFLNTLAFGECFGGKDYFGTEECVQVAREVNELYPGRVLTLGTIPNLNFIVYHAGFPYVDELAALNIQGTRPNLYVDLGSTFAMQVNTPVALAHTVGKLLKSIGADHICWGTDSPIWGSPQWQIEALRKLTIPDELVAGYGYPELTDAHKDLIFGGNMARL